ncbi:hypothetical protein DFO70_101209 [Cytobacillus firmus]|uniref:Uncharacterized protein n=2 Tax=Cytobacillus TaxID=2675230 RepID=A0A366K5J1_CYTFI|nr:hypothetical protein DFO70_101209 [Cytobacillus firmus]TDX45871.1 hypothetical protein DFO72_102348 [Cytobacillus oceanisediminis]
MKQNYMKHILIQPILKEALSFMETLALKQRTQ